MALSNEQLNHEYRWRCHAEVQVEPGRELPTHRAGQDKGNAASSALWPVVGHLNPSKAWSCSRFAPIKGNFSFTVLTWRVQALVSVSGKILGTISVVKGATE